MGRVSGFWVAALLWLSACGGGGLAKPDAGDGSAGGDLEVDARGASTDASLGDAALGLPGFEGIYAIQDVTLNPSSCAVEGPSALPDQVSRLFAAVVFNLSASLRLQLVACIDVTDCESKAAMERSGHVSGANWVYSVGGTIADLGGDTLTVGSPSQGQCVNETIAHATLTGAPRGMLRIEVQIVDVPAHAAVGAACDPTATLQAGAGVPCARLKVITGNYQQPL